MPSRHSQNNTAGAIFTHYEKRQLKEYGTQKQRLTRDNMKPFDACTSCLKPVVNPLADRHGDIYCKQCIYQYLLDQKKQIKKQFKEYKQQQKDEQSEQLEKEKQQENAKIDAFVEREKGLTSDPNAGKRKAKINNFWLPASTPTHVRTRLKRPSKVMTSPTGHPIKLKDLVPLNLTTAPTDEKNPDKEKKSDITTGRYMCPTCNKLLNNVSGVICIVPTGHVFCAQCMENVIKKEMVCPISNLNFDESDLLVLQSEGSSFAGRSGMTLEAVKQTPAPRL